MGSPRIACALGALALGCTGTISTIERPVGEARVGGWTMQVVASRRGERSTPVARLLPVESWAVWVELYARSQSDRERVGMGTLLHADFGDGERDRADALIEALSVDGCTDGKERWAFRLTGGPTVAAAYRVLYA